MKRGRLPLTAMRSFEAAGRMLSFSRAAEELFVSQAAISRQVRELEAFIGKPLFERLHRRVALTDAGRLLLDQLTASFDDIDRRLDQIMGAAPARLLRVSVEPAFAGALLVPRLNEFQRLHPEVDVEVDSSAALIEFRSGEAELAIRHSAVASSWPHTQARHLLDVALTPVMTSALLATGRPLKSPADLRHYPLLHEYNRDGWARWFTAAGFPELAQQRGSLFPDSALVMQAARLGHGVGLGDVDMEADDLRTGALVRPFDICAPYGAYWLVAPDFERLSPAATAFAAWATETFSRKTTT